MEDEDDEEDKEDDEDDTFSLDSEENEELPSLDLDGENPTEISTMSLDDLEDKSEEPSRDKNSEIEILKAKLSKALNDLEDAKEEMKATFTSNDTISTTINSLKGMIDALKRDQEEMIKRSFGND